MSATDKKIICRKCGGGHFTIKCNGNKDNTPNIETTSKLEDKLVNNINNIINVEKPKNRFDNKYENKFDNKYDYKNFTVKINNLPVNMTEEEMVELTADWGNIVKIRVNNYNDSSNAYIDFKYEDQANYFVKALDRTDFEYIMITVERC
jgi:hypothetical protein